MAARNSERRPTEPPYGGHAAGKRWFSERYALDKAGYKNMSTHQLKTVVERNQNPTELQTTLRARFEPSHSRSNREAAELAARDTLAERQ